MPEEKFALGMRVLLRLTEITKGFLRISLHLQMTPGGFELD